MAKKKADKHSSEIDLLKAKIAFIRASRETSPLGRVRRRPLSSLGCAFLLGLGLGVISPVARKEVGVLASLAELGGVASRILPLFTSRANSSGG